MLRRLLNVLKLPFPHLPTTRDFLWKSRTFERASYMVYSLFGLSAPMAESYIGSFSVKQDILATTCSSCISRTPTDETAFGTIWEKLKNEMLNQQKPSTFGGNCW